MTLLQQVRELPVDDKLSVVRAMKDESDFEVDGYRFIHENVIDSVQQTELSNDEYILGCFNASFLSGIINIDQDVIVAMQHAEAYEAVGKLVISLGYLADLQAEYSSADGYGHHFAHYDHEEHNINDFYYFRVD
jgi:hypothetical protein